MIPVIDVGPLFNADATAWDLPDASLCAAARDTGFVCIQGLPNDTPLGAAARAQLLAIFALDESEKRRLYRRKFAPQNRNSYRGWFPLQPGNLTSKEGIDIGGDVAHGPDITVPGDPLREASALPEDDRLPGWRTHIAAYYRSMERVAQALMRSLARSLALSRTISTIRFATACQHCD